jgi:hypothetical protein
LKRSAWISLNTAKKLITAPDINGAFRDSIKFPAAASPHRLKGGARGSGSKPNPNLKPNKK